jgi:ubiquinone/menaquinone biosynthesis C-methylase UbiE/uncharacterized protein YbaR (Trm112 family)
MKQSTLVLLCCPICKSKLSLNTKHENGNLENGELFCSACDRGFPIRNGIVHFIDLQELEGSNRRFARYYNRLAPFYSIFSKIALLPFGGERRAREEILDHLDLDGGRTLEVSIGNGVNLPYLFESPDAGEIFGIDISIGQLSRCRRLINKRGWGVDLFLAIAEALPFKDETFDNILHIGGINFFSDKRGSIDEMIRVARRGSKIVIADEAERLTKQASRSLEPFSTDQGDKVIENTIIDLVPGTMQDIQLNGIWKVHGKYHGYCLAFTKPINSLN